ncbi:MAG: PilZ domain-containing protein [Candidatus Sericytochromatia bacterium]|nr:PilZ domain-containing protein [Candidatus Sericytochromatia bacterium]
MTGPEDQLPPLKADQPLEIVLPPTGQVTDEETTYFSKIVAVRDEVLLIAPPILDGVSLVLQEHPSRVTCHLPQDTLVWACTTTIEGVMGDTWVLTRPPAEAFVKAQRRGNVRASMTLEVQAALFMAGRYFQPSTLRILDLSGAGCQLAGDRPFIPNSLLRLQLSLPAGPLELHGKVVRANPFPQGVATRYFTSGFQFTQVSEADREALVRFIFEHLTQQIRSERPPN